MYLVLINSPSQKHYVEQFLRMKDLYADSILCDELSEFTNELLVDSFDVLVFDFYRDMQVLNALRGFSDSISSAKVYVRNIEAGKMYTSVTQDIYVLPDMVDIMMLFWGSDLTLLDNHITAQEQSRDLISINLKPIDESTVVSLSLDEFTDDHGTSMSLNVSMQKGASVPMISEEAAKGIHAEVATRLDSLEEVYADVPKQEPTSIFSGLFGRRKPSSIAEAEVSDKLEEPVRVVGEVGEKAEAEEPVQMPEEVSVPEDVPDVELVKPAEVPEVVAVPEPKVKKPAKHVAAKSLTTVKEIPSIEENEKTEIIFGVPGKKSSGSRLRRRTLEVAKDSRDYMLQHKYISDEKCAEFDELFKRERELGNTKPYEQIAHKNKFIADEDYIAVLRDFLNAPVFDWATLSSSEVEFDTFTKELCKKMNFLELAPTNGIKMFVVSDEDEMAQSEIRKRLENPIIYVTVGEYIQRRLA